MNKNVILKESALLNKICLQTSCFWSCLVIVSLLDWDLCHQSDVFSNQFFFSKSRTYARI